MRSTLEAARVAEQIAARGYEIVLGVRAETAETPGFPGQIRATVDHERRRVRVAMLAQPDWNAFVEALEHELRHIEDRSWDCGSRDVFGRGGPR